MAKITFSNGSEAFFKTSPEEVLEGIETAPEAILSMVIAEIEAELAPEYLGGAYDWIDKKFDGAFTKAVDQFEKALVECRNEKDFVRVVNEAELYRDSILGYLKKYKEEKNLDDTESFLAALK